jgi:hydrogenase maturation protease
VRVLAVGSCHSDDQAGWQALDLLRLEDLPGVELKHLSTPLELLDQLENCRALVVLDACRGGLQPGSIVRLKWPLQSIDSLQGASSHGMGVVATLALAESLRLLLPPITLLGVEVATCEPGADLSPAVRNALPELCRCALHEVRTYLPPSPFPSPQLGGKGQGKEEDTQSAAALTHA